MKSGGYMRYKVIDETGAAMRLFQTLKEANAFLQDGWRVIQLPKPKKINPFDLVGECLF